MAVYSVAATLFALAFAVVVAKRFAKSKRPEFLAWTVGLVFFALGAGFQSIGEIAGFSIPVFRGFYLFGGAFGVIYLALGTVFLLVPKFAARAFVGLVVLVSIPVVVSALTVTVHSADLTSGAGIMGKAIAEGSLLFIAVVIFNIVGTFILIGGSAWSAFKLWRTRARADLLVCNVLLTVGASIIGAGFSLAKAAGMTSFDMLGLCEAIGILVMFTGFLSLGRVGVRSTVGQPQAG